MGSNTQRESDLSARPMRSAGAAAWDVDVMGQPPSVACCQPATCSAAPQPRCLATALGPGPGQLLWRQRRHSAASKATLTRLLLIRSVGPTQLLLLATGAPLSPML